MFTPMRPSGRRSVLVKNRRPQDPELIDETFDRIFSFCAFAGFPVFRDTCCARLVLALDEQGGWQPDLLADGLGRGLAARWRSVQGWPLSQTGIKKRFLQQKHGKIS
jgi:hypothetical protein